MVQGIGRHSYEYIKQRLEDELGMCSGLLATSGAYLTGSSPVLADCYLFALIDLVRAMQECSERTGAGMVHS